MRGPRTPGPDVVLVDINLPGLSGIECVRQLKPQLPATQFAMVTVYEDADLTDPHPNPVPLDAAGKATCYGTGNYRVRIEDADGDEVSDIRNVLERASARETASRVAVGTVCRQFLESLGVQIVSHVINIGSATIGNPMAVTFEDVLAIPADSELHCVSKDVEQAMKALIDVTKDAGDTVGGSFEVIVRGLPV